MSAVGLADYFGVDVVPAEPYAVCHSGDARLEWSVDVDYDAFGSAAVGQVLPALHVSRSKVGSVDDHTIASVEIGDALSHFSVAYRSLVLFAEQALAVKVLLADQVSRDDRGSEVERGKFGGELGLTGSHQAPAGRRSSALSTAPAHCSSQRPFFSNGDARMAKDSGTISVFGLRRRDLRFSATFHE
ncbi:hypothetical protein OG225_42435 (plasmid) [Nocardia sp. NBC_01377]